MRILPGVPLTRSVGEDMPKTASGKRGSGVGCWASVEPLPNRSISAPIATTSASAVLRMLIIVLDGLVIDCVAG